MNSSNVKTRSPPNELGVLLRHWRDVRGRSQFDLSLDTGVSQKQISFVESGRSVPGRQTLTVIAQALDIPLRDRNTLLLAAGYAPIYSEGAWNAPEMQSVTSALQRMLRQHEPFPAMVMDRYWNVLSSLPTGRMWHKACSSASTVNPSGALSTRKSGNYWLRCSPIPMSKPSGKLPRP